MEYVINQMIIFSPAERALFIINERESFIPLSNPATRLLLELVTHHKEMLTRRHLMQRVWEDNGFVGSNNNLNGCISEIRKAFESLALDPQIIITIPKLGFILEAEITSCENMRSPENQKAVIPTLLTRAGALLKRRGNICQANKAPLAAALMMIACFSLVCALLWFNRPVHAFKNARVDFFYRHELCNVFTLETAALNDRRETQAQIAAALKAEATDCGTTPADLFYTKIANPNLPFQVTFIAICNLAQPGQYGRCRTIKNTDGMTP
ncbi:winged helix-turn-helix domain-containing protein [Serratia ureilytica]|uniref:winged helix-turn-helix domain-containing protein n=1 Tax=Serratia ureilytica TaxID=300181 RepID=UPI000B8E3222|nr:winged helix-turn-helix domain-containing protein [Serratia ureilytica]MEB5993953.1 winged helix-turn-helix domain-containing protein [Serratia ureilytica]